MEKELSTSATEKEKFEINSTKGIELTRQNRAQCTQWWMWLKMVCIEARPSISFHSVPFGSIYIHYGICVCVLVYNIWVCELNAAWFM